MILGVGIDVVDVARFARAAARQDGLVEALLTPPEIDACRRLARPDAAMSGCFAAREAMLKALGTGLVGRMSWQDMEVVAGSSGDGPPRAPFSLKLRGAVGEAAAARAVRRTHLAITTTRGMAAAVVVLEGDADPGRAARDERP